MDGIRTLRVAGAQMTCGFGQREKNLARAGELAAEAAAGGARLVLFPEMMPSGYEISRRVRECTEPSNGPTVEWLRRTSADLGVFLGTTFAERRDGHIFNTFVLTTPEGAEAGRVCKTHAETFLFRGVRGPHVIECGLGRVGVGICADNRFPDFVQLMRQARVDLLLMPHASPAACRVGGLISESDVRDQHEHLRQLAPWYGRALGAPALFVNQCGPTSGHRGLGLLGPVLNGPAFHFPGLSTIADSDGLAVASLEDKEGVMIGDVVVDPSRYPEQEPDLGDGSAPTGRKASVRLLFAIDGTLGRLYYAGRGRRQ